MSESGSLAKRSTPELKKMLRDLGNSKDQWETLRSQSIRAMGGNTKYVQGIDKTLLILKERSADIMDVLSARLNKKRSPQAVERRRQQREDIGEMRDLISVLKTELRNVERYPDNYSSGYDNELKDEISRLEFEIKKRSRKQ